MSSEKSTKISELMLEEEKEAIKKTLKNVIYKNTDDCIVFKVAKAIYKEEFSIQGKEVTKVDLDQILEESIIFALRLFFIAYIEDNEPFKAILEENATYKSFISLRHCLYSKVIRKEEGYSKLVTIFDAFDKGNIGLLNFPVSSGGLFSKEKACYLNNKNLLNAVQLEDILTKMLFFSKENAEEGKYAEYSKLDFTIIGELQEALLEYELRVTSTNLSSSSEYESKVNIYLTSRSLCRKTSGAYYTPKGLVDFMAASSIDKQLETKYPLDIKIIDNSCGSGNFLVSCLDYLTKRVWDRLSEFRDVEKELDMQYKRILDEARKYGVQEDSISKETVLKRMLLKRCIYGVDINPISVELTKLSLWVNSFIFATPPSFIEHHIRVGNSLLGYTKDEFFIIASKKFQTDYPLFRKKIEEIIVILKDSYQKINGINDTTKKEEDESRRIYKEYEKSENKNNLGIIFSLINIYKLSFAKALKIKEGIDLSDSYVSNLVKNILNNKTSDPDKENIEKIKKISSYYKVFHYGVEFPDAEEGFDIVIGNPPWEKTKFDESEFFAKHIPSYRKLSIEAQNKIKKEILGKNNHPLSIQYIKEKSSITALNNIYKFDFKCFSSGGDPNLFKYFTAFSLKLIKPGGNLTYLVPFNLWNGYSSRVLRKYIFNNYKINYIYQFENKKRFKDVHSSFKFAIFQLSNTKDATTSFKVKFMIQRDDFLKKITRDLELGKESPYRGIKLTISQVRKLSPIYESIVEVKDKEELRLVSKIFSSFSVLSKEYIDFKSGLELSTSKLKSLVKDHNSSNHVFLFSGANIHQYNSNFFTSSRAKEKSNLFWIDKKDLEKILTKNEQYQIERILYRSVARNTDERTMISTLSPKNCYCTSTLFTSYEKAPISIYKKLFVVSILNSLVFDFTLRRFVNLHVCKSWLYQCPMPQPEEEEIISNPLCLALIKNTALLVAKNDPANFAYLLNLKYLGFNKESVREILALDKEDEFFCQREAENNFIVASLYSLTKQEFSILLSDFRVLKNKKGKDYILFLKKGYKNYLLANRIAKAA
ncbi:class I SAM-dependent DNA methyltransferase (plasmid) [Borrelia sp. A-FGy1]|uniref:class I SAM-dependent DNA methyltransferase n=1 Tax=Borrelia sp. A-FGy1 TaxID=2608247 RepID=UPI0015F56BE4|nr:class I SAM-dependent DNA methyltransferase [Borrelia sp. A-FGy1]QMU99647.1 class I SAM-dependent DNA methyltransferase [Borrelia sp. A-FGy1]